MCGFPLYKSWTQIVENETFYGTSWNSKDKEVKRICKLTKRRFKKIKIIFKKRNSVMEREWWSRLLTDMDFAKSVKFRENFEIMFDLAEWLMRWKQANRPWEKLLHSIFTFVLKTFRNERKECGPYFKKISTFRHSSKRKKVSFVRVFHKTRF